MNSILFITLSSSEAGCGEDLSGLEFNGKIKVYLPYHFPNYPEAMGYATCSGSGYFDLSQLEVPYPSGWEFYVTTSYGSAGTLMQNKRYGNLPGALGSGIREFFISECTEVSYILGTTCHQFHPVRFKKNIVNTLNLIVVSPCGYYLAGRRTIFNITYKIPDNVDLYGAAGSGGGGLIIKENSNFTDLESGEETVFHLWTCNPC